MIQDKQVAKDVRSCGVLAHRYHGTHSGCLGLCVHHWCIYMCSFAWVDELFGPYGLDHMTNFVENADFRNVNRILGQSVRDLFHMTLFVLLACVRLTSLGLICVVPMFPTRDMHLQHKLSPSRL